MNADQISDGTLLMPRMEKSRFSCIISGKKNLVPISFAKALNLVNTEGNIPPWSYICTSHSLSYWCIYSMIIYWATSVCSVLCTSFKIRVNQMIKYEQNLRTEEIRKQNENVYMGLSLKWLVIMENNLFCGCHLNSMSINFAISVK